MTLPVTPPIKPMLAKVSEEIPRGEEWIYEPKWDGFRTLVFRDGKNIDLRSRNDRPLNRYFPEIEQLLLDTLPQSRRPRRRDHPSDAGRHSTSTTCNSGCTPRRPA